MTDYYLKALALVADELERLKPEELDARRWKLIAIIRNAIAEGESAGLNLAAAVLDSPPKASV